MQTNTQPTRRGTGPGALSGAPSIVWLLAALLVSGTASTTRALFTHAPDAVALSVASGVQLAGWCLAATALWRRRPLGPTLCLLLWSVSLVLHALRLSPVVSFVHHDMDFFLGLGLVSWAQLGLYRPAVRAWFARSASLEA